MPRRSGYGGSGARCTGGASRAVGLARDQVHPKKLPSRAIAGSRGPSPRGFSLLELIVVLAITMLLASLLMPALSKFRANVHRVISASNMRQVGIALSMYAEDNNESLPYSRLLALGHPEELMAAHTGAAPNAWDGMGLLFQQDYCRASEVFYAPSHRGNHPLERYRPEWSAPSGTMRIYTNYHYAGHEDWETGRKRSLRDGEELVVVSDGLRTREDLNHDNGLNMLHGDLAVRWRKDRERIVEMLPTAGQNGEPVTTDGFEQIWRELDPKPSVGDSVAP